jgi:hypothetical protein
MVARPATYQDLLREIRFHFPNAGATYSLVVLFQPLTTGGRLPAWVEVAPSAYCHVHDGAELLVNVLHPLTKEYILPLPGLPFPNHHQRTQVQQTDGYGNPVGDEPGHVDATALNDQVSKIQPTGISSRPGGSSHRFDQSVISIESERPGGDAFASGWAGASEHFQRSTRLVPNLQDCKEAVGQAVGESNFYPEDEEQEDIADVKLGAQPNLLNEGHSHLQHQYQQVTETGWNASGLEEGPYEDKQVIQFHSDHVDDNLVSVPQSPRHPPGTPPGRLGGPEMPITPRRSDYYTPAHGYHGWAPSGEGPSGGASYQRGHNLAEYGQGRSCSTDEAGAWNQQGGAGGWNNTQLSSQQYSGTHHLTNGVAMNDNCTNLENGNGDGASQYSQDQDQRQGASDWSPPSHQPYGYRRPQDHWLQSSPLGEGSSRAFAASGPRLRPRHDPAEVSYGSPKPRIRASPLGWSTIGQKNHHTYVNIPLRKGGDPERAQASGNKGSQAWGADLPPPSNSSSHGATGHWGDPSHRHGGGARYDPDQSQQQKQGSGRETTIWGSDFWGGPPPNSSRNQRGQGTYTRRGTPAQKHWE